MIKQIDVGELRVGMYVDKLDTSWMNHPFLRNQFKINEISDVGKIKKSGAKVVYINTEKGLDVNSEVDVKQPIAVERTELEQSPDQAPASVSVAEEMEKALIVRQEAGRVITNIMADVRLGKQVDTEQVSPVVEQMLGTIFRNQDAFLGLTRIRDMDQYTFEHSISVSALMIAFAKKLGLDESVIWEVGVGGILHDIGKLQVPEKILNKPGRLTEDEFSIMRGHVGFGTRLVDETDAIPKNALRVLLQHHERLNGTGYPGRLSGEEISLYGKMAAIVDVYDAITSDRVYHKGKMPSVVLRQLIEWSGEGVFDQELVQRFIQCVGIYPVGTVVALESQRLAVVIASPQKALLNPVLNVIYDLSQDCFLTPEYLNLAESASGDRILKPVSPEQYNIQIADYLDQ
ncbi:MAG: HD-GYP domain-containing protein [Candidatus Thiodiazotropha sp. 6PLUC9]